MWRRPEWTSIARSDSAMERCSLHEYTRLARRLVLVHIVVATIGGFILLPLLGAYDSRAQQVAFIAYAVLRSGLPYPATPCMASASREAAAVNATASTLLLSGVATITVLGRSSVAAYLWAFAGSALVEFVAASTLAARLLATVWASPVPGQAVRLLRSGPPALVLILAQTAILRGDRLVIAAMASTRDVGLYAAAATGTELMAIGAFAAAQVLFQPVASGAIEPSAVRRVRCSRSS